VAFIIIIIIIIIINGGGGSSSGCSSSRGGVVVHVSGIFQSPFVIFSCVPQGYFQELLFFTTFINDTSQHDFAVK
jgi:hypothetical protein